ncbi:MAG: 16S rRNA (cytidine(1402)-2'-O)-methyltransferase [Eggerthellaceae bacterium]|nr:16S rRNA (cytidine(1402)-2'-O)-methyltransferase [Eggerthellaceae bacterium]
MFAAKTYEGARSGGEGSEGGRSAGAHSAGARSAGGRLIICPTPIGNLGDMPPRALEALRAADVVCAEDTRVTGKLLSAFGIEKRLERLDEGLIGSRSAGIVERVLAGEVIAYCSDAGMPGVSDPGLRLVAVAREAGACVEVLPGPTAAATAYVASGCANPRFYFGGFFPRKSAEQHTVLTALKPLDAALIFYESPNRLVAALSALAEVLPLRTVTVCRELTKLHEEVARGSASELQAFFAERAEAGGIKGEIVIVVDGPSAAEEEADQADSADQAQRLAATLAAEGLRTKDIAKRLVAECGISRNDAYDMAMEASKR